MRTSTTRIAPALALMLTGSLAGCDTARNTAGPDAAFTIAEETLRLRPGGAGQLTIQGAAATTLVFNVRHADVATVTESGRVQAGASGITWIVAQSNESSDSVRVVVSLSETPAAGVAFQFATSNAALRLAGVSRIIRPLRGGRTWTQVTAAVGATEPAELHLSDLFDGRDTMMIVQLDGVAQVGQRSVTPWKIEAGENAQLRIVGAEGALLWIRDPSTRNRVHIYVPVGPIELDIERSDVPDAVGPATGSLVGRMSFEAAGLILQVDENGTRIVGQVATQTTMLYAEFALAQRIQPIGGVRASITGGPSPFEPTSLGSPNVAVLHGGLLVHGGGLTKNGYAINYQIWAGTPAVGDVAIRNITVEELAARTALTATRSFAWTETGKLDDLEAGGPFANLALATSGILKITRFDAPGADTWGALEAVLTTRQALILGGSPNDTQDVVLEIAAPVAPTSREAFAHIPSVLTNTDAIRIGAGIVRVSNGKLELGGRVVETGETAVEGVAIDLVWSAGAATVRTNAQGEFVFTGVTPGDYEARIHVPEGYTLAEGQRAVIGPINVTGSISTFLPIAFADAEGNGALRIFAGTSGVNTTVDNVVAHVRPAGSSTVTATLVTGAVRPGSGTAHSKLPPGRYEVDFVLPAGYAFTAGQASTVNVEIRKGLLRGLPVGVVRQ